MDLDIAAGTRSRPSGGSSGKASTTWTHFLNNILKTIMDKLMSIKTKMIMMTARMMHMMTKMNNLLKKRAKNVPTSTKTTNSSGRYSTKVPKPAIHSRARRTAGKS